MRQSRSIVTAVIVIGAILLTPLALGFYRPMGINWAWHMNNNSSGTGANRQSMTMPQAVQAFNNYLSSMHNSNLALHEVEEYQYNFYASVNERDTGNFAFQLLIWKLGSSGGMMNSNNGAMMTGVVMPEPGPNMMWNTKYSSGMMSNGGMMGGYTAGSTGKMTISPEQAHTTAQQYLNNSLPGRTAGDTDTYYGYYTIDILLNSATYGMVSVNGYSGQVWYHTWHGAYMQTVTLS